MNKRKKIFIYLASFVLVILVIFLLSLNSNKLPRYNAQKSVGNQTEYTITGIEAGAGIMSTTQKAVSAYGLNKSGWQLQTSSTAVMLSQLGKAMKNHQSIVITGWLPHWMFEKYNIKFLSDPQHVYGHGSGEHYDTVVKKGFNSQNPGAYQFLKNFSMQMKKVQPVVSDINNGESTNRAAEKYIQDNPQQVKKWLKGVPKGKGQKISLAHMTYSYETFASKTAGEVLKDRGYKVSNQGLDPGIMWTSIATKSVDATVTAELPITQKAYANKYKGKVNHVRANLKGARIGLAVPKYMKNINSINDLKN